MPELKFHPEVSKEIKSSYYWYENKAEGLGGDFLDELEVIYQAIVELPKIGSPFQKGFRRFLLLKFPFSIIYRLYNTTIYVVAVMHHSRKPGYWLGRINS